MNKLTLGTKTNLQRIVFEVIRKSNNKNLLCNNVLHYIMDEETPDMVQKKKLKFFNRYFLNEGSFGVFAWNNYSSSRFQCQ